MAENCTRIMVWHTMTSAPSGGILRPPRDDGGTVNAYPLFKAMVASGLAKMDAEIGKDLPVCLGADCMQ